MADAARTIHSTCADRRGQVQGFAHGRRGRRACHGRSAACGPRSRRGGRPGRGRRRRHGRRGARGRLHPARGPGHRPHRHAGDGHLRAARDGTAVVEMAEASGLQHLPAGVFAPLTATTYGTGELLLAALDAGATSIVFGVGGSATTDGGAGHARGARRAVPGRGRRAGRHLAAARCAASPRPTCRASTPGWRTTDIVLASDVDNPLTGPKGAPGGLRPAEGRERGGRRRAGRRARALRRGAGARRRPRRPRSTPWRPERARRAGSVTARWSAWTRRSGRAST